MKKLSEILKNLIEKISAKTRLSKGILLAVLLLAAGVAALLLSELDSAENTADTTAVTEVLQNNTQEYAKQLENRLISIISSIDGAGSTRVMITLESGSEDIYLHDYDYGENNDLSGKNSIERKDEYVIVDSSAGEQGIVVRRTEPKVRGVAVVCEGGGSELVRQQITDTVTALLDISSARVSVAKMNK